VIRTTRAKEVVVMRLCRTALAVLVALALSSAASAGIIDYGTYTTDTKLGLDYLDVGLVHGDYSSFVAGVTFDGRTWVLATPGQLASTWSDATGLALSVADILSGDNNMGFAATAILLGLFDGVTTDRGAAGERVVGDYDLAGYYNFIAGGSLAVHDVFDDSHYQADTSGRHGAWLVSSSTASVPDAGSSLFLLGIGLVALRSWRKQ